MKGIKERDILEIYQGRFEWFHDFSLEGKMYLMYLNSFYLVLSRQKLDALLYLSELLKRKSGVHRAGITFHETICRDHYSGNPNQELDESMITCKRNNKTF